MNDEQFLSIIDATPLVSIDLIISNQQGEVLLGKRVNKPAQGYWFVPGGRIRKNETIAAALKRISTVELGFEITEQEARLQGVYDHIYEDNYAAREGINTHYVVMGMSVALPEGQSIASDLQHSEMRWWSPQDLLHSEEVHQNTRNYFLEK